MRRRRRTSPCDRSSRHSSRTNATSTMRSIGISRRSRRPRTAPRRGTTSNRSRAGSNVLHTVPSIARPYRARDVPSSTSWSRRLPPRSRRRRRHRRIRPPSPSCHRDPTNVVDVDRLRPFLPPHRPLRRRGVTGTCPMPIAIPVPRASARRRRTKALSSTSSRGIAVSSVTGSTVGGSGGGGGPLGSADGGHRRDDDDDDRRRECRRCRIRSSSSSDRRRSCSPGGYQEPSSPVVDHALRAIIRSLRLHT